MKSKKWAIKVFADFCNTGYEDEWCAQVLDACSVILNYGKHELKHQVSNTQIHFCKKEGFYENPGSTRYGRQFWEALKILKLVK